MVQIYQRGNENFQQNGDAVLTCYSCDLTAELNGTWVLDAEVPIDDEGRWKFITEESILKVSTWQDDDQLYRVAKVTKTEDGVGIFAYPIFYDSANDCFLMDVRPTGKTGQQALDIMTADSPYSGVSNITSVNTAYFVRRNLLSAIAGDESPTFLERWGGEILYDNYRVIINNRVGGDYGVEARYGRNIEGVTYIVDTTSLITRIVPISYNGHLMSGDTPWVDSPNINSFAKVYTKEIRYENIRMAEDAGSDDNADIIICDTQAELDAALLAAAQAEFANGCDAPVVTLDIDMAMVRSMRSVYTDSLQDTGDSDITDTFAEDILAVWYRDYATLETIRLGDTIRCRHYKLDITSTSRVISLTWDCLTNTVKHVTLGDYQYNYVKDITGAINRVNSAIRNDGSIMAERVQGFLDGAQTQLRTQYNLATRQDVMAILFENLDQTSPMYGALGIGTQGICISKTRTADGRDWDWTTGITANGINASAGVFGILSDRLGLNYINLDTGEISFGSGTQIGGQTIDDYMQDASDALAAYAQTTDATIRQIQDQIDGQYETYFENYTPALNNYPANEWTTEALKESHEGDLFYNKSDGSSYRFFQNDSTGVWEWTLITDTVATQALALASQAKDTADGKRRVFTATPVPPYDAGDLYFTGSEILVCVTAKAAGGTYATSDFIRKDAYNTQSAFNDFLTGYQSTISGLQSDIDDRIETWPQTTDPSTGWTAAQKAEHAGDIWYNTSTGVMKYWTGTAWADMTTTPPASVINTINSKAVIFTSQPTPPYKTGDLWFDSASADIMTCISARASGSYVAADWQKRNKYTDDSAVIALRNDVETIQGTLQTQIDGKVETWYQPTDPSTGWTGKTLDAVIDTTEDAVTDTLEDEITGQYESEKVSHFGDIWHNSSNNTQWRYSVRGEWEEMSVPDSLIDTVDGKKRIFSSEPTPPYDLDDLWVQGATGDILVCVNARGTGGSFSASDWELASKYTDDSALMTWIAGDYADTIDELRTQTDGKAETWYQAADPSLSWDDPTVHRGDLWYNTTNGTTWFWSGSAWQQQNVPNAVFDKIDTKAQIFAEQPTVPYHKNDLWFTGTVVKVATRDRLTGSYTAGDWVKKDYYTDDSALTTFIQGEFASLKTSDSQKIETWSQTSDPSTAWTTSAQKTEHTGDLWYNTTASVQKTYRWTGTAWAEVKSTPPQGVTDTINGKANIFIGSSTPASPKAGDLWMKSANDDILTYVSGSWVKYNKYTDNTALNAFISGDYADTIADLQRQEDGKAETWIQTTDPSTAWSTAAEKTKHKGDIWYNTTAGVNKYYMYSGTAWTEMKTEPPAAIMDVIDGKAQIFASQPTVPYYKNDIWFTGTDIKVSTKDRTTGSYTASDWVKKDNYTDDSALTAWIRDEYADDMQNIEALVDGKIETWYQTANPAQGWSTEEKAKHTGDIWQNSGTQKVYRYTGSAWQEMKTTPPDAVMDTIDGKAQIFSAQPTIPYYKNDLWYTGTVVKVCVNSRTTGSYSSSDWVKKDYYTDDSALETFISGEYANDIAAIQNQVDRKIETWYQKTDPSTAWTGKVLQPVSDTRNTNIADTTGDPITGHYGFEAVEHVGDIWQNSTNNTQWRWDGGMWVEMEVPDAFIDKVDGKSSIFVGSEQPVNPQERDLWFKGVDEGIYTYVGGKWTIYNKYTDDENLDIFVSTTYADKVADLQGQIDGKIETWFYGYTPTSSNFPASQWTSTDEKKKHIGDLFYNVTAGQQTAYRYTSSYAWEKLTDKDITKALTDASTAQSTADGKMTVFTGNTVAPPYSVGDMWLKGGANHNELMYCISSRATGSYSASDWSKTPTQTAVENAAKTATNYMHYDSTNGLVISTTGEVATGYNTQITADGVRIRNGATASMFLTSDGLYFYKPDGRTIAAKYTANGFEALIGKIAGFTFSSSDFRYGTLGAENSAYISPGGTAEAARIGGSQLIRNWTLAVGDKFGVTKEGALYCNDVTISGKITATSGSIAGSLVTEGINAANITVGKIQASQLNVSQLSALSTNLGSVTAGEINIGNGAFVVTSAGALTATSGTFKGTVSAGSFLGGSTGMKVTTDGGLSGGNLTIKTSGINASTTGGASFNLTSGGAMTVTGGSYTGSVQSGSSIGALPVISTGLSYTNSGGSTMSITTNGLSMGSSVSIGVGGTGKISNIIVDTNAIYSAGHTAYDSTTKGFYLDKNGYFGVGGDTNYLRFNQGTGRLDIKVNSFSLTDGRTIDSIASSAVTNYVTQANLVDILTASEQNAGIFLSNGKLRINASMITTGTLAADRINSNSITASKLSITSLDSICNMMSGIHIESNKIYSGNHSSYNSSNDGFCLESGGSFGVGNSGSYIRFNATTGEVSIKATSFSLSNGSTIETIAQSKAYAAQIAAQEHADTAAANALSSANQHADSADSVILDSANNHADTVTTEALNVAKSDASTKATNALNSANSHSDSLWDVNFTQENVVSTIVGKTQNPGIYLENGQLKIIANDVSVDNLAAISANLGNITAGSITIGSGNYSFGLASNGKLTCSGADIGGRCGSGITLDGANSKITLSGYRGDSCIDGSTGTAAFGDVYAYKNLYVGELLSSGTGNITTYGNITSYGTIYQGNTEVSLKGHTHSEYAVTNHTHTSFSGIDSCHFNRPWTIQGMSVYSVNTAMFNISGSHATIGYGSSSSRRYKDILRKLSTKDIERAFLIEPVIAKYKDGYLAEDDQNVGKYMPMFIAEEVEEFVPEATVYRDGKTEDWNTRVMIPVMFQMIKSLKAEIKELKKQVEA